MALGTNQSEFTEFTSVKSIEESEVDYKTCKCLLGIWNPVADKIALFPGSTVPNLLYIKRQAAGVANANCMMSGYYNYYENGYHNPSVAHAHEALRLATNIVLRRSYDDLDFTGTDTIEVGNPHDNIHAAYIDGPDGAFSSAGCQVIVGQPKCVARGAKGNTVYWKVFHDIIYEIDQQRFAYALLRFADGEAAVAQTGQPMQARLRFGSQGATVLALQQALATASVAANAQQHYFCTNQDGAFGKNTLQAVLAFQTDTFGATNADGVVGPKTAQSLGILLPML